MRPSSSTIETLTSSPLTIQKEIRALCTRASGVGEKTLKMCGRTTSGGELLSFCVTTNAPSVASTSRPNAMRARRVTCSQLRDLDGDERDVRHLERVEGGEAARVSATQQGADGAPVADDERRCNVARRRVACDRRRANHRL